LGVVRTGVLERGEFLFFIILEWGFAFYRCG
jgi:hypothetical protein